MSRPDIKSFKLRSRKPQKRHHSVERLQKKNTVNKLYMWRFRKAGHFLTTKWPPGCLTFRTNGGIPPSRGFYHLFQLGTSFIQAVGRDANPSAIEIRAFRLSKDARDPRDLGRCLEDGWTVGRFLESGFLQGEDGEEKEDESKEGLECPSASNLSVSLMAGSDVQ